jgi:hypothetical protein
MAIDPAIQKMVDDMSKSSKSSTLNNVAPTGLLIAPRPRQLGSFDYNIPVETAYDKTSKGDLIARYDNLKGAVGNEDRLAREQGALEQVGYGLLKNATKTLAYALDATVGSLYGVANGIQKGKLSAVWDNDFSNALDDFNKRLDYKLPNRMTDEEKNRNFLLRMVPGFGASNFWANDVAGGLAFVGGALIPSAITGALTGGATLGSTLAKASLKRTAAGLGDDVFKAATRKVGKETLEGAEETLLRNQGKDFLRGLNKAAAWKKGGDIAATTAFLANSANFEAGMEARHNFHLAIDNYFSTFEEKNGRKPTETEISDFMVKATKAANGVYGANMAILSVSNAVMFGKTFDINIIPKKLNYSATKYANKLIGLGEKTLADGTRVALKANRAQKIAGKTYKLLGKAATEGIYEEGFQGVAGKTMQNYLDKEYDPNNMASEHFFTDLTEAFKDQYTTNEGWTEMGIGMIIGMGAGVFQKQGIEGFGKNSYSAAVARKEKEIERSNQGLTNLQTNIGNMSPSVISRMGKANSGRTTRNSTVTDVPTSIDNLAINLSYIQSQEDVLPEHVIKDNFETTVSNMTIDEQQKAVLAKEGLSEAEYKQDLLEDFNNTYKKYQKARTQVNALGLNETIKDANLIPVQDAITWNLLAGQDAFENAEKVGRSIEESVREKGIYDAIQFYSEVTADQQKLLEERTAKQKELDELFQKAVEINTAIAAAKGSKISEGKLNTLAEQYAVATESSQRIQRELDSLDKIIEQQFKASDLNLQSGGRQTVADVLDSFNKIQKVDDYITALKERGRVSEAADLQEKVVEFKFYSDAHREMTRSYRAMLDTNFFKSKEGEGLLASLIGPKFEMSAETREMIRENSQKLSEKLGQFGITREQEVEEALDEAIKNNPDLSEREKYRLEAMVRLVASSKGLSETIKEIQKAREIIQAPPASQGDSLATLRNLNIELGEETSITLLDEAISKILANIDFLRSSAQKNAQTERLQTELAELQRQKAELVKEVAKQPITPAQTQPDIQQPLQQTTSTSATKTGIESEITELENNKQEELNKIYPILESSPTLQGLEEVLENYNINEEFKFITQVFKSNNVKVSFDGRHAGGVPKIASMDTGVINGKLSNILTINQSTFGKLSKKEKIEVIAHEFVHGLIKLKLNEKGGLNGTSFYNGLNNIFKEVKDFYYSGENQTNKSNFEFLRKNFTEKELNDLGGKIRYIESSIEEFATLGLTDSTFIKFLKLLEGKGESKQENLWSKLSKLISDFLGVSNTKFNELLNFMSSELDTNINYTDEITAKYDTQIAQKQAELKALEQQLKQEPDATQNNQEQKQESNQQSSERQYQGIDEGERDTPKETQSEADNRNSAIESQTQEIDRKIAEIETQLASKGEPIRMAETGDYKRFETLSRKEKKGNLTEVEKTEKDSLRDVLDQWLIVSGVVAGGVRLSDLISQKTTLEEAEVNNIEGVAPLLETEMLEEATFTDSTGVAFTNIGDSPQAVTATFEKDPNDSSRNRVVMVGIRPENISVVITYTDENGEKQPIDFDYSVQDGTNNIIIGEDQLEVINNTVGRNVTFHTNAKKFGRNWHTVIQHTTDMSGNESSSFIPTDFIDYMVPRTPEAIYNAKEGGIENGGEEITLKIDTRDEYNKNLVGEYKEALSKIGAPTKEEIEKRVEGKVRYALGRNKEYKELTAQITEMSKDEAKKTLTKKAKSDLTKIRKRVAEIQKTARDKADSEVRSTTGVSSEAVLKAKEKFKRSVRITAHNSAGENLASLKGKRTGKTKKNIQDLKFEQFRDSIIEDDMFLEQITSMEAIHTVVHAPIAVQKVKIGFPNVSYSKDGSGLSSNYSPISEQQAANIIDIGYIANGKTKTKEEEQGIDTTFLATKIRSKDKNKTPFIVVRKGERKIAIPVRVAEQLRPDNTELQNVFNSDAADVFKVNRLNELLAERGVDIKKPGESFYSLGTKSNLTQEFLDAKLSQIESNEYLYPMQDWMTSSKTVQEIVVEQILTNIDLSSPVHSPKVVFDFSKILAPFDGKVETNHTASENTANNETVKYNSVLDKYIDVARTADQAENTNCKK